MPKYTLSVFTEDKIGLLNRVSVILTRRHINIESITASESEIHGVYRYTLVIDVTEDQVIKIVKQIEKQIDIHRAFYHLSHEVISREIALFKISNKVLAEYEAFNAVISRYHATIINFNPDYLVVEKTGNRHDIELLYHELKPFDLLEYACSGSVAISKPMKTLEAHLLN
jgi:acetolactate synthase-1/3 small subunit